MEFYSLEFAIFIVILLAAFYIVEAIFNKKKYKDGYQWIVILIGNIVFYSLCGVSNLVYILISSLSTFIAAFIISKKTKKHNELKKELKKDKSKTKEEIKEAKARLKKKYMLDKRIILVLALLINVGILAYLKYWANIYEFFMGFNHKTIVEKIAEEVTVSENTIFSAASVAIPLGISFYTFQSISYLIDIYNDKYEAERNFFKYLSFVSFFPQLIQGPINRYDQLGKQINGRHELDMDNIHRGLLRVFYGFLKKYAVADMLSPIIMAAFRNIDSGTPGSIIVFTILLYSAQQYCDFSGGIDMVMGVAKLMGIDMMENFRQPYFSRSLGEFWRRWHISLGAWMRDYIFYPLALTKPMQALGKSCKKIKNKKIAQHFSRTLPACIANIVVFFIVGLWHGSEAHFILWGLYNGIVIALSDMLSPVFEKMIAFFKINKESKGYNVFAIIRTFIVVNIGWYFDVIVKPGHSFLCLKNTFLKFRPGLFMKRLSECAVYKQNYCLNIAIITCIVIFIVSILKEKGIDPTEKLMKSSIPFRIVLYTSLAILILLSFSLSSASTGGFMYANY